MKIARSMILWISVGLASLPAWAQEDYPKVELFGGYSYKNADPSGLLPHQHAHGWGVNLAGNFHKHFGVTADFSGGYGKAESFVLVSPINILPSQRFPGFRFKTHDFLFGPRVAVRTKRVTGFGHVLFGVVKNRITGTRFTNSFGPLIPLINIGPYSESSTSFATGFGGGVDANLTDRIAVRLLQVDYIPVRAKNTYTLTNVRLQTGIAFRF